MFTACCIMHPRCCRLVGWNRSSSPSRLPSGNIVDAFYIHGSVNRDSILIRSNEMQQYAGIYLLQNYSTCFGCLFQTSSGLHQTVTAASGTGHITCRSNNRLPAWPNESLLGHAGRRLLLRHVL